MAKKSKTAKKTKPHIDWSISQSEWMFLIHVPKKRGDVTGPAIEGHGHLWSTVTEAAIEANEFIAVPHDIDGRVKWCRDFDPLLCKFRADGRSLVAIRKASEKDKQRLRLPSFIQNEEWPLCCGRSMQFVAQIDDNDICMEPPPDAELWWHDAASFYVFTCAKCLECKALGQQF